MVNKSSLSFKKQQEQFWWVSIPQCSEFSEPRFHFGERVKFQYGKKSDRVWESGWVVGMKYDEQALWIYLIVLDENSSLTKYGIQEVNAKENELMLFKDLRHRREQRQNDLQWFDTGISALKLGVSAEQLRKLRRKGMFKSGYHYRDISIPGSGKPRWQWHIERCTKALEVPPEKRCPQ